MDTLPVEILEYICIYCNDRSIINISRVSKIFYIITKDRIHKLKNYLIEYSDITDDYYKNYNRGCIIKFYINKVQKKPRYFMVFFNNIR